MIISLFILDFSFATRASDASTSTIDIVANNETLQEVTGILAKQTGYTISLDPSFQTLPVNGSFSKISIENFYSRVLRGKNSILQFDEKSKSLSVLCYGSKDHKSLGANTIHQKSDKDIETSNDSISDLDSMRKSQHLNTTPDSNDNTILGTSMTLNELKQKRKQMLSSKADPGREIILGTNMTVDELKAKAEHGKNANPKTEKVTQ